MKIFRRKKAFCTVIVLIIIISLLKVLSRAFSISCSFEEIEAAIGVICDNYNNRDALGNACAEVCGSEFSKTSSCLPHHLGKDVVFLAHYRGQKVVVKSSKLNTNDFDQIFWVNSNGSIGYPNVETFYNMVKDNLQRNLNIKVEVWNGRENHLVRKLWNADYYALSDLPANTLNTAMSNIWHLMQQNEYLFLKYYEDINIFPKILGTCGHFYIVEHIDLVDNLFMVLYPTWKNEFSVRAGLALKILDYAEYVTSEFPDLHICDVKMGHFGLDRLGNIKFLDVDMVFFKPSLIQNILAVEKCLQNEDCSFINCQGSCDNSQQICESKVLNTNFQRICLNIFCGKYFGLLSFPPREIADKLRNILIKCSKEFYNVSLDETVSTQLRSLLQTMTS